MSPRGRKQKPAKAVAAYLRVINAQESAPGDDAKEEKATAAPSVENVRFVAPHWFDERDRAIFDFLQDHCFRLGILEQIDQPQLQALAREVANWQRCEEEINAWREKNNGSVTYVTAGRNGKQYKTIPQVAQSAQHLRHIAAFGSNFGLSPVDRERLKYLRRGAGSSEQADLLD